MHFKGFTVVSFPVANIASTYTSGRKSFNFTHSIAFTVLASSAFHIEAESAGLVTRICASGSCVYRSLISVKRPV